MAVDLSGLPELPDTSALRSDATQIKTVGNDVDQNCIDTRNAWTPVDAAIISPTGQEQMVNALEVMLDYGDGVSLSTQAIEQALSDYCDGIDALKSRYDAAVGQAQMCWAESTPEDPNYRENKEQAAQTEVNAVADLLLELEQTCADSIKAANPSAPGTGAAGHPATGAASSSVQDVLERLRVDQYSFEILDSVTIETRVSAFHLEIQMADGIENPDMTESERRGSAIESAAWGAGGAAAGGAVGAFLGSVIPIPVVGTVVGGVVGGFVGELAGNTIDNMRDGDGFGDAIGDAWNSLWG